MAKHSEHYPTMIVNEKTGQRVAVKTPLDHHRQLLAWKQPGLDPVPAPPVTAESDEPVSEPGYPTMIVNEETKQRVRVDSKADHDAMLAFWAAKEPAKSTTRVAVTPAKPPAAPARQLPPPPPAKPPTKPASAASKTSQARGAKKDPPLPPTVEELLKKNYAPTLAQRMADEEIRKYNAGIAPYGPNSE